MTGLALLLTVVGWTLMWTQALDLFDYYPTWVPLCMFSAGLALIPFRQGLKKS